jgi:inward rectifier potassium channel
MLRKKNINISKEEINDLGFGSKVTQQSQLNRDGSFNVERKGLAFFRSISPFHALLTMSWWKFHLTIFATYLLINFLFGFIYWGIGVDELAGDLGKTSMEQFLDAFFFSVHTFTTVGYGNISPQGTLANVVATFDAFVGLMMFALATGLLFARFSRPKARIMFSRNALIAPYRGINAFEFRITNERRSQLIEVEIQLLFSYMESVGDKKFRRFFPLQLERNKVAFLPLHLTVVHPIDRESPLAEMSPEDYENGEAEFLVLITAIDETFSQTVHSRSSYRFEEIVWQAKFSDMFQYSENGAMSVDIHRLHAYETLDDV